MIVIITDSHYRMATSLIRDLGSKDIDVITCEYGDVKYDIGGSSKYVKRKHTLNRNDTIECIIDICKMYILDNILPVLIPVGASTQILLSENQEKLKYVCDFLLPLPEHLALFNNKKEVAREANTLSIPVPRSYNINELNQINYPVVIKPDCGEKFGLKAESRYIIADSHEEMISAIEKFKNITGEFPVIQEYLSGGGYGCSVLCLNGVIYAHICHKRVREYPITGGPSSCAEIIEDDEILEYTSNFIKKFGYTGVAMFEYKADKFEKKYLLEINPRIWGTFPLTRVSCSNFSLIWYDLARGFEPQKFKKPNKIKMIYHPTDIFSGLGYLKNGERQIAFGSIKDFISSDVKNGLYERNDKKPAFVYIMSLLFRKNVK